MAQSLAEFDRGPRRTLVSLAVVVAAIAIGAIVIAVLEALGVADASPAFLLAVVAVAVLRGAWPAVVTAIAAFLAYDFFFIEPLYTFTVRDPEEWLNLLLLLVVGVVVGRLAGSARARAEAAIEGERSARAMFDLSYTLSTRRDTPSALRPLADIVRAETKADRVWIAVGDSVQADTGWAGGPPGSPAVHEVLRRRPGESDASRAQSDRGRQHRLSGRDHRSRPVVRELVGGAPEGPGRARRGGDPGHGRSRRSDRDRAGARSPASRRDGGGDLPAK
jgi:uncharacterized protein DUF4118